jgi:RNA polymerase sigma-70 factor, ECF subfamily
MHDARSLSARVVTTLDEDDALAQAAALDPRAFAAIYERNRTSVYRYLRSRTTSDDEAGELCAVTFERALAAIGRFRSSGGGMLAWLLRIARNAHIDTSRRRLQNTRPETEQGDAATAESGLGLEDQVILRSLVGGLPVSQRDAIQLRFAAGLTAREIGAVLGVSEEAAQKQLERALQALKEAYRVD